MGYLVVGIAAVIVVVLIVVFLILRAGRRDDRDDFAARPSRDRGYDPRAGGRGGRAGRGREQAGSRPYGHDQPGYDYAGAGYDDHGYGDDDYGYGRSAHTDGHDLRDHGSGRGDRSRDGAERAQRGRGRYDTAQPAADYPRPPSRSRSGDQQPGRAAARQRPAGYGTGAATPARGAAGADYPSGDFEPVSISAQRAPATGSARSSQPAARRSQPDPAKGPEPGRNRSSRGKRGDDDEWDSSEWDSLSDEQYWKQLSSDKPLATMARPAQPAPDAAARAETTRLETGRPARSTRSGAAGNSRAGAAEAGRGAAATAEGHSPNGRSGGARAADSRAGDRTDPGRSPAASGGGEVSRRDPVSPSRGSRARNPADAGSSRPLPVAGATPEREHVTERLPVRQAQSATPAPAAGRDPGEPSLAMLASLAGQDRPGTRPRDEDDPLTSPAFSRNASVTTDSRSYANSRRSQGSRSGLGGQDPGRHLPGSYPAGTSGQRDAYRSYPGQLPEPAGYPSSHPAGYPDSGAGSRHGTGGRSAYPASSGYGSEANGHDGGPSADYSDGSRSSYPGGYGADSRTDDRSGSRNGHAAAGGGYPAGYGGTGEAAYPAPGSGGYPAGAPSGYGTGGSSTSGGYGSSSNNRGYGSGGYPQGHHGQTYPPAPARDVPAPQGDGAAWYPAPGAHGDPAAPYSYSPAGPGYPGGEHGNIPEDGGRPAEDYTPYQPGYQEYSDPYGNGYRGHA